LQEQARGALISHAEVTIEPSQGVLDDLAAFQETVFSSPGVENLALAILAGATQFPDPDPELNELEQQGKVVFNRACGQCHGGTLHPSTSTPESTIPRPIVRYHNILTQFPRPPGNFGPSPARLARNAQKYRVTLANGTTTDINTSDPGRLLLTGQIADLGMFDVPNLRGISKTAPYFHNNSAATLEEMLDHYDAFFLRVAANFPPPALLPPLLSSNGVDLDRAFVLTSERAALLAYLRKI
jgi:cytochrome c peroxidase